ncbi:hypothetical protein D9C73_000024 [Collichthys lucidus]|uniref:Uncharacterized protein n=1 Tax=Collichthys lucidus TaxID=240159 RepID=A0A4U5TXG0_COLLU|nr:hypothetical protein D9C73_000024 [Collichthys lucidus]
MHDMLMHENFTHVKMQGYAEILVTKTKQSPGPSEMVLCLKILMLDCIPGCISYAEFWLIYYRFAQGLRLRQVDMLHEGITGSSATLSKLADRLRRVCKSAMRRMRRRGKQAIGKRGELVLIDERKFGHKRKVSKCRKTTQLIRQCAQQNASAASVGHPCCAAAAAVSLLSLSASGKEPVETMNLPVGESNPGFRVTGGDTVHYTNEEGHGAVLA